MDSVLRRSCRTLAPVTAVGVCGDWVLAAQGRWMHVFFKQKEIFNVSLLKTHAIHGFRAEELRSGDEKSICVLAWGGRMARTCGFANNTAGYDHQHFHNAKDACIDLLEEQMPIRTPIMHPTEQYTIIFGEQLSLPDYVMFGTFRLARYGLSAIVITAHSALYAFNVLGGHREARLVIPGSTTLCFSATARWLSADSLLVAYGTAFGTLIVQSMLFGDNWNSIGFVQARRDAHEGAIYDTTVLYLDRHPPENRLFIATCSDDRTIRLWNATAILRDSTEAGSFMVGQLIQKSAWTWAHNSRVWNVAFGYSYIRLPHNGRFAVPLFSSGEDAQCHVWCIDREVITGTSDGDEPIFRHLCTTTEHSGKNVWSIAGLMAGPGRLDLVSGGADGALHRLIVCAVEQERSRLLPTEVAASENTSVSLTAPLKDQIRNFCWVQYPYLVTTTRAGDLCVLQSPSTFSDPGSQRHSFICLSTRKQFAQYCVLESVAYLALVLVGTARGSVHLYNLRNTDFEALEDLCIVPGKVLDITARAVLPAVQDGRDANILAIVITVLGRPEAKLLLLCEQTLTILSAMDLSRPTTAPVSSLCAIEKDGQDIVVLLGDREGWVMLYRVATGLQDPELCVMFDSKMRAHEDAITSIVYLGPSLGDERPHLILTTSRDGTYSLHRISLRTEPRIRHKVHHGAPPFGPLIEGAYIHPQMHHLILYGFQGDRFLVYDETSRRELASVNCKGGHRLWSFVPQQRIHGQFVGTSLGHFVWSTSGALNVAHLEAPVHRNLLLGGHGREIKACAICPLTYGDLASSTLLATGAEDTDIRLFEYLPSNRAIKGSAFRCVSVLRKHNTGIQQLQWSSDGRRLFSCGGSEELFIWRIAYLPLVEVGVVCEAQMPRSDDDSPDLRICGFDINETVNKRGKDVFEIVIVLSDSTIRLLRYDTTGITDNSLTGDPWRLCWQGRYTVCCLTNVRLLSNTNNIVVTATDGAIMLWDTMIEDQQGAEHLSTRPQWQKRIHRSAVKDMTCVAIPELEQQVAKSVPTEVKERSYLLITAGDDNALTISISHNNDLGTTLSIPRAHAASITAIESIHSCKRSLDDGSETFGLTFASCGTDQQIKLWGLTIPALADGCGGSSYDLERAGVRMLSKGRVDVADASGMKLVASPASQERELLVVGVGMEIVQVEVGPSREEVRPES